jgi:excisionase family DNA binding protein
MIDPDTITTAQAAGILRCSVRTIARMVEAGRLTPEVKFPGPRGGYLFARAEVERARDEAEAKAEAS